MRVNRVLVALGAVVILFPAVAFGASVKTIAPTKAQRTAILKAFGDPSAAAPCLNVRIAASNHSYGTLRFRNTHACANWAFNGVNVFKRGKHNRWRVVFEGSSYSCPLAHIPKPVQRDFGICP